jgi:hypothetical protein
MWRPLVGALRNPISRIGIALTTACASLLVFLLLIQSIGLLDNPYSAQREIVETLQAICAHHHPAPLLARAQGAGWARARWD